VTYLAETDLRVSGASKDNPPGALGGREPLRGRGALEGPRPALISRIRFQLPGALLFAGVTPFLMEQGSSWEGTTAGAIDTAGGIFAAIISGFYALRKISNFPTMREVGSVIPVFTVSYLAVMAMFLLGRFEYSRFPFIAGYILTVAWFTGVLILAQRVRNRRFVLVPVGETRSMLRLPGATWHVADSPESLPGPCNGVVADLRAEIPGHWQQFLTSCALAGIPVYHYKDIREAITGRLEIEHLSENVLGSHNPNAGYRKFKRFVDFVTAAIAMVALGPFLLAVGLLIRLDTPGPALFRQARMNQGGKSFMIYKFRTMSANCARPGSRQDAITVEGDPRITRLGAFLRKTRIDELPQMINILKGEMSWIGPRPEAVPLANWYQEQLPFYQYRHIVQPGITGWAQVNQGHVTDLEHVLGKLHYDFYYIKNFSIWLDIMIVLKTIRTMLTGFGAR
jgi:lipopolysaccharide/colanic/teichoic acid biosynthesis glycosyltransferase